MMNKFGIIFGDSYHYVSSMCKELMPMVHNNDVLRMLMAISWGDTVDEFHSVMVQVLGRLYQVLVPCISEEVYHLYPVNLPDKTKGLRDRIRTGICFQVQSCWRFRPKVKVQPLEEIALSMLGNGYPMDVVAIVQSYCSDIAHGQQLVNSLLGSRSAHLEVIQLSCFPKEMLRDALEVYDQEASDALFDQMKGWVPILERNGFNGSVVSNEDKELVLAYFLRHFPDYSLDSTGPYPIYVSSSRNLFEEAKTLTPRAVHQLYCPGQITKFRVTLKVPSMVSVLDKSLLMKFWVVYQGIYGTVLKFYIGEYWSDVWLVIETNGVISTRVMSRIEDEPICFPLCRTDIVSEAEGEMLIVDGQKALVLQEPDLGMWRTGSENFSFEYQGLSDDIDRAVAIHSVGNADVHITEPQIWDHDISPVEVLSFRQNKYKAKKAKLLKLKSLE